MNFLLKRSKLFQLQSLFEEIRERGGSGLGEGMNGGRGEGGNEGDDVVGRVGGERGRVYGEGDGGGKGREGTWNMNFLESGRELLEEENLEVIINNKPVGCQAWFLNDLIVVMQKNEILGLIKLIFLPLFLLLPSLFYFFLNNKNFNKYFIFLFILA